MIQQQEIAAGVVLRFRTPDGSPDLIGPVRVVDDGYVWMCGERWPLDVVARESEIIPRPSPRHQWDGALEWWFLPEERQISTEMGPILPHTRHA